jgi:hypothetical protein
MTEETTPEADRMDALAEGLRQAATNVDNALGLLHYAIDGLMASFKDLAAYVGAENVELKARLEGLDK